MSRKLQLRLSILFVFVMMTLSQLACFLDFTNSTEYRGSAGDALGLADKIANPNGCGANQFCVINK